VINKIKLSHTVKPEPHTLCRKEKNCYLLVNRKNGAVLVVNDLGIDIWNHISEKITVEELVKKLMKKYHVRFELSLKETLKFIEELLRNEFVHLEDRVP